MLHFCGEVMSSVLMFDLSESLKKYMEFVTSASLRTNILVLLTLYYMLL